MHSARLDAGLALGLLDVAVNEDDGLEGELLCPAHHVLGHLVFLDGDDALQGGEAVSEDDEGDLGADASDVVHAGSELGLGAFGQRLEVVELVSEHG